MIKRRFKGTEGWRVEPRRDLGEGIINSRNV